MISERRNLLDEAERYYRQAIEVVPDFGSSYYRLGLISEKRGDVQGAARLYAEALKLSPGNDSAHYRLGRLLIAQGKKEQGARHLELFRKLKAEAHPAPDQSNASSRAASPPPPDGPRPGG